jgi:hypothetical protein
VVQESCTSRRRKLFVECLVKYDRGRLRHGG